MNLTLPPRSLAMTLGERNLALMLSERIAKTLCMRDLTLMLTYRVALHLPSYYALEDGTGFWLYESTTDTTNYITGADQGTPGTLYPRIINLTLEVP